MGREKNAGMLNVAVSSSGAFSSLSKSDAVAAAAGGVSRFDPVKEKNRFRTDLALAAKEGSGVEFLLRDVHVDVGTVSRLVVEDDVLKRIGGEGRFTVRFLPGTVDVQRAIHGGRKEALLSAVAGLVAIGSAAASFVFCRRLS